jgi:hypothetical protein
LSEQSVRVLDFIKMNPYAGLFEVMDRMAITSEPVLDAIGYYALALELRQAVYDGEMDLYQIYGLSRLPEEIQPAFWKAYHDQNPPEFHEAIEKVTRFARAADFVKKYGSSPEEFMKMSEITEEEAGRIFKTFMERYPKLRETLKGREDVDL